MQSMRVNGTGNSMSENQMHASLQKFRGFGPLPLLSLLYLWSTLLSASEPVLRVIELNNRPAEEIQPIIVPLLHPADRVIARGSSLIVRSTPDRLVEIEQLIHELDSPVASLIISVIQDTTLSAREMNARAKVKIQVPVNAPEDTRAAVKGQFSDDRLQDSVKISQRVRTLEGQQAYIQAGSAHPVQNYPGQGYQPTTDYIDTTTGFAVTPRLSGDQVFIQIAPWSDKMRRTGVIDTQSARTTVRAELGQWVEIGGISDYGQAQGKGLTAQSRSDYQQNTHLLIKVDKTQ